MGIRIYKSSLFNETHWIFDQLTPFQCWNQQTITPHSTDNQFLPMFGMLKHALNYLLQISLRHCHFTLYSELCFRVSFSCINRSAGIRINSYCELCRLSDSDKNAKPTIWCDLICHNIHSGWRICKKKFDRLDSKPNKWTSFFLPFQYEIELISFDVIPQLTDRNIIDPRTLRLKQVRRNTFVLTGTTISKRNFGPSDKVYTLIFQ